MVHIRYFSGLYGIPKRNGTLENVDKFDNMFFGVPPRQVNALDPRHKILLETTYECIVDAGYNPKELKGSRTGKFLSFLNSPFHFLLFSVKNFKVSLKIVAK